jgi:cytochrome c oxidase cbb3-type subunit 3
LKLADTNPRGFLLLFPWPLLMGRAILFATVNRGLAVSVVAAICVAGAALAYAQGRGRGGGGLPVPPIAANNPFEGNAAAIQSGRAIYGARCSACHGDDARGVNGPDLTSLWLSATPSDAAIYQEVQRGVPGTEMAGFGAAGAGLSEREIWETLAYVRSLSTVSFVATSGDGIYGERVFRSVCSSCHVVNGRGGQLGPDLSRIGASRSRAALSGKVRGTSTAVRAGYEAVTLVTRDGQHIRGVRKNEDGFSIQLMDTRERLQGYLKADLAEVVHEPRSLMPAFGPDRMSDRDLDDLLRYLSTLRGSAPRSAE